MSDKMPGGAERKTKDQANTADPAQPGYAGRWDTTRAEPVGGGESGGEEHGGALDGAPSIAVDLEEAEGRSDENLVGDKLKLS